MRLQLLALLASAGFTNASKDVVSLFLLGYDTSDLEGKIVDSFDGTTTYALSCPKTVSSGCGLNGAKCTIEQGLFTAIASLERDNTALVQRCFLTKSSHASCVIREDSPEAVKTTHTAFDINDDSFGTYQKVTVAVTTTTAAEGVVVEIPSATDDSSDNTPVTLDNTSSLTTPSSTGSNAAMPMNTGNAQWAAGGAAAAMLMVVV